MFYVMCVFYCAKCCSDVKKHMLISKVEHFITFQASNQNNISCLNYPKYNQYIFQIKKCAINLSKDYVVLKHLTFLFPFFTMSYIN